MFSIEHIDPFFDTHAGFAFPSGDPFLVYPGADGEPWSSIRAVEIIYEGVEGKITFENYPQDAEYLYRLRNKVAAEMKRAVGK